MRIRYAIWSSDGTPKDFIPAPQSAIVAIPKLLPGFREALLGMKAGEKRRLWIPESLGAAGKAGFQRRRANLLHFRGEGQRARSSS